MILFEKHKPSGEKKIIIKSSEISNKLKKKIEIYGYSHDPKTCLQKAFKEVLQVTYDERQRQYFKNAVVAISWLPYEEYGEYGELIELAVRNQGIEWVLQELDKTWKPSDSEEKVRDRLHKAFDRRQKEIEVNSEEDIPSGDCSIMRL
ncbi:MAG: hypothetical protein HYT75_02455 [Deltaproteobacteria bacterium]|nr:hypothetical protein [Deltaproteobacteria bacterium]